LLLAAFDDLTADFDEWYAIDSANTVNAFFDQPYGNETAVAVTADGVGVAVIHPIHENEMQFFVYRDGEWGEGLPIGFAGVRDALAADGRCVHLVYDGADDKRRHATFDGEVWHATDGTLEIDPDIWGGSLAARDGELVYVFRDASSSALTSLTRKDTWQAPIVLDHADTWGLPRIAALRSGAEFMVVHGKRFTTRINGDWEPLEDIPGAGDARFPSIAAVRDGRAVVAWSVSGKYQTESIFYSFYDPFARTWTSPSHLIEAPVSQPPIVASGAEGEEFYLAFTLDQVGDQTPFYHVDGGTAELVKTIQRYRHTSLASTP
jgi:hypothetical protein